MQSAPLHPAQSHKHRHNRIFAHTLTQTHKHTNTQALDLYLLFSRENSASEVNSRFSALERRQIPCTLNTPPTHSPTTHISKMRTTPTQTGRPANTRHTAYECPTHTSALRTAVTGSTQISRPVTSPPPPLLYYPTWSPTRPWVEDSLSLLQVVFSLARARVLAGSRALCFFHS